MRRQEWLLSGAQQRPERYELVARMDRMTTILETERVRLREFRNSDLDDLAAMVADVGQMRFYPRPRTRVEASAWIERNLSLYRDHGFGFWLMESLQS